MTPWRRLSALVLWFVGWPFTWLFPELLGEAHEQDTP